MPTLDLTHEEYAALTKLLRDTIDHDRFFLAPRLDPFKAILAKLQPPAPEPPRQEPRPKATAPRLAARKRSQWS